MLLKAKIALVTGSTHNIGLAIARAFAREGAKVIVHSRHVASCGDCHTPRNSMGVPNQSLYLAGASEKIGPLGQAAPNITPDKDTGIGEWKQEEIVELLHSGMKPDSDTAQGLMAEVIQGAPYGYKNMKKEDALAIADYLKSIPPIKNKIK